jgi:hypothetical protein
MRVQRSDGSARVLRLSLSALVGIAALAVPITTYAADSGQPAVGGKAEQTPEEAAGGRLNLIRIKKACEEDIKRLCADIRPGGGRLLQCLRGKPDNLSPACREVMASRSANR